MSQPSGIASSLRPSGDDFLFRPDPAPCSSGSDSRRRSITPIAVFASEIGGRSSVQIIEKAKSEMLGPFHVEQADQLPRPP